MSIEHHAVSSLRVRQESSFAADETASAQISVPCTEGATAALEKTYHDPQTCQQTLDQTDIRVGGIKSGKLDFSMVLAPSGVAAGDGATVTAGPVGTILAAVMGNTRTTTGSTITSGFDPAHKSIIAISVPGQFSHGTAVGVHKGPNTVAGSAGTSYIAREIQSIDGAGVATLKLDTDNTMSAGDVVYGSYMYALGQDPQNTLQFQVAGAEADDRFLLSGCQLSSMSFELPVGGLPKISFSFMAADYKHGRDTATTITGALGIETIVNHSPVDFTGEALFGTVGSTTLAAANKLAISELTLEPQISYIPVKSPGGTNTISRWRRNRTAPALTGSFVVPFEDETTFMNAAGMFAGDTRATSPFEARDDVPIANTSLKYLFVQMGEEAGKTILISVPTLQITGVERVDADGIAAQRVSFIARHDGDTEGINDDRARSSFRIHLL